MYRLNWGLAIASNGTYQVIDTTISPGIRDEWSIPRVESFSFFVAPADYVDSRLGLTNLNNYDDKRRNYRDHRHQLVRDIILAYFGTAVINKANVPTWSSRYRRPKEKEWGDIF